MKNASDRLMVAEMAEQRRALAKRGGKLFRHHIGIVPGDIVTVEISPYDLRRGRIVYRGRSAA